MLRQAARFVLVAILCVLLVGFGVCGVVGLFLSFQAGLIAFMCGLAGIGIAWAAWSALAEMWRKRPAPPGE
jgi:hypothetical protein